MNIESKDLKDAVKRWIINVDKTEGLPSDIVALRFNLLLKVLCKGYDWFDLVG